MKPGKDLDALVAEKVMGFWFDEKGRCHRHPRDPISPVSSIIISLSTYSTDIKSAWEIVEHNTTESRYVRVIIETHPLGIECEIVQWGEEFDENGEQNREIYGAIGDTAPHAICLAALKACGVKL